MALSETTHRHISGIGLLVLRLGSGIPMLIQAGIPKFQNRAEAVNFQPTIIGSSSELNFWLLVFAEVVCAALVALGFLTRLAAIPLVFAMGVAFFVVKDGNFNEGKDAFFYAIPFLALIFTGAGTISVDHFLFRRKVGDA